MKSLKSLVLALFVISGNAIAAGPYDGVWTVSYYGSEAAYASIHERDGTLLIALLDASTSYEWEALMGTRSNTTATINTLVSDVFATFSVSFSTTTTGTVTQLTCFPKSLDTYCAFPNGAVLNINKLF